VLSGNPPGVVRTSLLAGGSHLVAREIDPAGIQVLSFTPGGDINIISGAAGAAPDPRAQVIQSVTSTASWIGVNWLLARVAKILPLPRWLVALALGVGVYLADDAMVALVAKLEAKGLDEVVDSATGAVSDLPPDA